MSQETDRRASLFVWLWDWSGAEELSFRATLLGLVGASREARRVETEYFDDE